MGVPWPSSWERSCASSPWPAPKAAEEPPCRATPERAPLDVDHAVCSGPVELLPRFWGASSVEGPARASLARALPPREVITRAEDFFTAYVEQSKLVLEAVSGDGYADFVDTALGKRLRSGDAADAVLRLNTALYSVVDDLRRGALALEMFGHGSWLDVAPGALFSLALDRLASGTLDVGAARRRMEADPLWSVSPVSIEGADGLVPRDEGHAGGLTTRSLLSLLASNGAALQVAELEPWRMAAEGAARVARAAAGEGTQVRGEALFETAMALYRGGELAPVSSAVLPAIIALSEVSPIASVSAVPWDTTPEALEAAEKRGECDGFVRLPGGGLATFSLKSLTEVAKEVTGRLDRGELGALSAKTRERLGTLVGPREAPGQALEARLGGERSSRFWREVAGTVIEVAAVSAASGGVGAFAETAALEARLGVLSVRAARFVATSGSFTTLMGAKSGELGVGVYVRDAAMFGLLQKVAAIAPRIAALVPGRSMPAALAKLCLSQGVAVGLTAGTMTAEQVAEDLVLRGRRPNWGRVTDSLLQQLAVVGTLHGVSVGVARLRPLLAPGSAERAGLDRLVAGKDRALGEVAQALDQVDAALGSGDVEALGKARAQLDRSAEAVRALAAELEDLAHRGGADVEGAEARRAERGETSPSSLPRRGPAGEDPAKAERETTAAVGRDAARPNGGTLGTTVYEDKNTRTSVVRKANTRRLIPVRRGGLTPQPLATAVGNTLRSLAPPHGAAVKADGAGAWRIDLRGIDGEKVTLQLRLEPVPAGVLAETPRHVLPDGTETAGPARLKVKRPLDEDGRPRPGAPWTVLVQVSDRLEARDAEPVLTHEIDELIDIAHRLPEATDAEIAAEMEAGVMQPSALRSGRGEQVTSHDRAAVGALVRSYEQLGRTEQEVARLERLRPPTESDARKLATLRGDVAAIERSLAESEKWMGLDEADHRAGRIEAMREVAADARVKYRPDRRALMQALIDRQERLAALHDRGATREALDAAKAAGDARLEVVRKPRFTELAALEGRSVAEVQSDRQLRGLLEAHYDLRSGAYYRRDADEAPALRLRDGKLTFLADAEREVPIPLPPTTNAAELDRYLAEHSTSWAAWRGVLEKHGIVGRSALESELTKLMQASAPPRTVQETYRALKDATRSRIVEHCFSAAKAPEATVKRLRSLIYELNPSDQGSVSEGFVQQYRARFLGEKTIAHPDVLVEDNPGLESLRRPDLLYIDGLEPETNEVKSTKNELDPRDVEQNDAILALMRGSRGLTVRADGVKHRGVRSHRLTFIDPEAAFRSVGHLAEWLGDYRRLTLEVFDANGRRQTTSGQALQCAQDGEAELRLKLQLEAWTRGGEGEGR